MYWKLDNTEFYVIRLLLKSHEIDKMNLTLVSGIESSSVVFGLIKSCRCIENWIIENWRLCDTPFCSNRIKLIKWTGRPFQALNPHQWCLAKSKSCRYIECWKTSYFVMQHFVANCITHVLLKWTGRTFRVLNPHQSATLHCSNVNSTNPQYNNHPALVSCPEK